MTEHPCVGRTKRQIEVFEQIAIGMDKGHSPLTIDALMKSGLIALTWETIGRDGFGPIRVPRYHVPLSLHMQWCEWCSENVPEEL